MKLKLNWLLLSCLGLLLWALPAAAGRLVFWRFESSQNRLVFTTDSRIQPRAQLIFDPSRIVIDLPGTTLGRPTVNQAVGGTIRSVRVGQFDSRTTRIVIEIAPGYTVDPQQVKIRPISATQWTVDLPKPVRETSRSRTSPRSQSSFPSSTTSATTSTSTTASSDFRITRNGLYVGLSRNGDARKISVKRSRDRKSIEFTLPGALLSPSLRTHRQTVNDYGLGDIQFEQVSSSPPTARLSLQVTADSPEWQANYSRLGGIVLLPRGGLERLQGQRPATTSGASPSTQSLSGKATIQSVKLASNDTQLLIQADRSVQSEGKWNRLSGYYEIRIANAELADNINGPQLRRNSPIYQLRIRQEDATTVAILLRPAVGTQLGTLQQTGNGLLALDVRPRGQTIANVPPRTSTDSVQIFVPPPPNTPLPPPRQSYPPRNPIPPKQRGKVLVMIDPGHGGKDPGAIGLRGLQEKDVILPISQDVAKILQQQGVQTMMTRNADYFVSLQGRTDLANRARADIFVSIHANAVGGNRSHVNGLEVYYYGDRRLSDSIHRNILGQVNVRDRKVRRARFYVLRRSRMPATLVEVGFLTGYEDNAKLSDPNFRRQMAAAIANGILDYIRQYRL